MPGHHIGSYVERIPLHCRANAATKELTVTITTTKLTGIAGLAAIAAGLIFILTIAERAIRRPVRRPAQAQAQVAIS